MQVQVFQSVASYPGRFAGPQLNEGSNCITVSDGEFDKFEITHDPAFSTMCIRSLQDSAAQRHRLTVSSEGVRVDSFQSGRCRETTEYRMTLQPEQYRWAGMNVAGSLIGFPLGLVTDMRN